MRARGSVCRSQNGRAAEAGRGQANVSACLQLVIELFQLRKLLIVLCVRALSDQQKELFVLSNDDVVLSDYFFQ